MSNWINKSTVHTPKDGLQYKPQEKNLTIQLVKFLSSLS